MDQPWAVVMGEGTGFPASLSWRRRLVTAACVLSLHAIVLALLAMPMAHRTVPPHPAARRLILLSLPVSHPPAAAPTRAARISPRHTTPHIASTSARPTGITPGPAGPTPSPVPATHNVQAPVPTPSAAQVPVVPVAPVTPVAPDRSVIATYDRMVWQRIAAHRPADSTLQGTVLVGFRLDRAGRLSDLHVQRPSGITLLDRLALRIVREAAPFPPPPTALADADLTFTVPVNFL